MTSTEDRNEKPPHYSYYNDSGNRIVINLPFPTPIKYPPPPGDVPVNPNIVAESCAGKIIIGGIMGGTMGAVLGIFMGAMGDVSPIQVIQGKEVPTAPLREQMRVAYKATGAKSLGWVKTFGVLSALFGGVECLVEKQRAKHDVWNPVISGCIVGATLSAKAGPAASCMGCVGFAGFSFVVDKIMGTH